MIRIFIMFLLRRICSICSSCLLHVRPEWFGAVGDGVEDDSGAFEAAIRTGKSIVLTKGAIYLISSHLPDQTGANLTLEGNGAIIKGKTGEEAPFKQSDDVYINNVRFESLLHAFSRDKDREGGTIASLTIKNCSFDSIEDLAIDVSVPKQDTSAFACATSASHAPEM